MTEHKGHGTARAKGTKIAANARRSDENLVIPPTSYFYHSFPRRFRANASETINKGIDILASIKQSGFLLTPEITEWREPLSDGSMSEPWKLIQKRCCFTELSPPELAQHTKEFGEFSLEFDIQTLRELGAIPVFYIPRSSGSDSDLESLAASLLVRMGELQRLLDRLAELQKVAAGAGDKSQALLLQKDEQVLGPMRCSIGGAEDLISFLAHGGQPVSILRNALRALSGFFYPAEDFKYTGLLAYYRQREWRIVANMSYKEEELTREPDINERRTLLNIDEEFFGQELKFFTGNHRRVKQCQFFDKLDGKPIIQYVRRVIVPEEARHKVSTLLNDPNDPPIVALEGFAE